MQPRALCMLLAYLTMTIFGHSQTSKTGPTIGLHENPPGVFAFTQATLVISPTQTIENATLVVRDGVIVAAGDTVTPPKDAMVISMEGKTIYPGFIDLYSSYGMPEKANQRGPQRRESEASAASATGHWNEKVKPETQAMDSFKSDEKKAKQLRELGFTAVVSHPQEGLIRGSSALVLLGEGSTGTWVLNPKLSQTLNFNDRSRREYPGSLMGVLALFRQAFMDAQWYETAWSRYQANPQGQTQPETNAALAALADVVNGKQTVVFEASSEWDVLKAAELAGEFGLKIWVVDAGTSYRRLDAVVKTGVPLILPLNYPEAPEVSHPDLEKDIDLREMKHWYFAPENPARLVNAGAKIALSAHGLEKEADFLKHLRQAAKRGLSEQDLLAALTTTPAAWLGQSKTMGTLAPGALANFFITDGPLLDEKTAVHETWVRGQRHRHKIAPANDLRGMYTVTVDGNLIPDALKISGEPDKLAAQMGEKKAAVKFSKFQVEGSRFYFTAPGKLAGTEGTLRGQGWIAEKVMEGELIQPDGSAAKFVATYSGPVPEKDEPGELTDEGKEGEPKDSESDSKSDEKAKSVVAPFTVQYPDGAFGRNATPAQPKSLLLRNATVWTSGPDGILQNADVLVESGKIKAVGRDLKAAKDALIIDATGKHVTPGLIDAHSHTAIRGGVNEGTHSITAEVRIEDVVDPDDINIYRQLAGGLTMGNLLHGSANTIGGQNAVAKWRWGANAQELLFDGAMPGIKFALGENVKQANWGEDFTTRYPQTRMGVEQFIRDSFLAAKAYRSEWQAYESAKDKASRVPPRKILTYDVLLEILDGKRQIHCHSYRQDEILALIRIAEEIGFKIDTFTHILEGYKVAEAMAKHGAMGSTFSDWWAYKMEVYDAIAYAGAIMHQNKVIVSFKSDSDELARRLNTEAAKAGKYGGVSPEDALKFVTLNPAKQLRIDGRVGSLEKGKDADFVIWNGDPLSSYSLCEQTWIDGRKYFDRAEDQLAREEAETQRQWLIQQILNQDEGQGKSGKMARGRRLQTEHHHHYHGDGADDEESN